MAPAAPSCRPPRGRSEPALALPRRVETSVLHRTLSLHLATFLARAEERGGVPRFVEREFRRFLECGIPAHGFLRVHCAGCGHDRIVPFSCKGRGFCPSCGGRRMSESAAHLVDSVIPEVPVRQWVLSLPFSLRFALARDHALLTAVITVVMRAILGFQRRRARRLHGLRGRCGSVSVVQRFGGTLNLNVHLHAIVLDGVHVQESDGHLRFQPLLAPIPAELHALTETIALRVRRLLGREGRLSDDEWPASDEPPSALDACQAASVRNVVAFGPRAGRPLRKIVLPAVASSAPSTHESRGVAGFDLDVGPPIPGHDRRRLERLCRYALRPAIASERLEELPDGRLKYRLRHPWRDGTTATVMEPMDFLSRLAALVPAPRRHVLRYHGTLAPNAKWRRRIVPKPPPAQAGDGPAGHCVTAAPTPVRPGRISWA